MVDVTGDWWLIFRLLVFLSGKMVGVVVGTTNGSTTTTAAEIGGAKPLAQPPNPSYLLETSHKVNVSVLHPSQLMWNSSKECEAFTNGSSDFEFASPNYPRDYPHDIDCIKIITAPEGQVVQVQFHDFFHVESPLDPSMNCPYDYLEIRTGKFGYSPTQGRICGKQPPTLTKSSGRYLWLRFHSDSSVNHKGFRATIQFLPDTASKPDINKTCVFEIDQVQGDIESKLEIPLDYLRYAQTKQDTIDCTWVIQAPLRRQILLRIHDYSLEQPNNCNYNALEVYDSFAKLAGNTNKPFDKFCGSQAKQVIKSEDHVLAIRLTTKIGQKSLEDKEMKKLSQFRANYTIIRTRPANVTQCEDDEFNCSDDTCIPIELKCNNRSNCQLKVDEDNCPDLKPGGLKADIFIIAFMGALLVVGMCTGMFLNIFRKLKQDRQEIQELRALHRKSKESGMGSEAQSQRSICPSETNIQNNHQNAVMFSVPRTSQQSTIEEQSSTESRDTVIHKPITSIQESTQKSDIVTESTKRQLPPDQPSSLPGYEEDTMPLPQSPSVPSHAPSSPSLPTLQLNQQRKILSRRASDVPTVPTVPKGNLQVAVYRRPDPPFKVSLAEVKGPSQPMSSMYVPMQFVRDCACQTRESYLMARRYQALRAPLARAEAIEFFQGTPIRRHTRSTTPTTYFPPSSASSEIGNSLERLDEEFE